MRLRLTASTICLLAAWTLGGLIRPPLLNAADFYFSWKAGGDPAIAAYGVYQRIGGADYVKIDEVAVEELANPAQPAYRVTGLSSGTTYWFAATSISASGAESSLSSETCIQVNGQIVDCTEDDDSGTTVFISCFITAAGKGKVREKQNR